MMIQWGYMCIVLERFIECIVDLVLGFILNDEGSDVGMIGWMAFLIGIFCFIILRTILIIMWVLSYPPLNTL